MYYLKEETIKFLKLCTISDVAKEIGINRGTLSEIINKNRPCMKLTAYAITKLLDSEKEISDFFYRKES